MTELIREEPAQPNQPSLGSRLTGWKDIAAYLDRGVRTAQRWERDFGLPVRRIGTDQSESVFAFTFEIDEWLATTRAAKARGLGQSWAERESRPDNSATAAVETAVTPRQGPPVPAVTTPRRGQRWLLAGAFLGLVAVTVWRVLTAPEAHVETASLAEPWATALAIYSFEERAGTALLDTAKANAHGSITNGVWAEGRVGSGLDFQPGHRSGQHMVAVFPGAFPFHAPGTDASLSFWVFPVDRTHRTLFWTRGDAHSPDINRFHIYSGGVQRTIGPAIGVDYVSPTGAFHLLFEVPVAPGRWTHVALVRTGTRHYTLYLNGNSAGTFDDVNPELPTQAANWALWRMEDNPYPKQNGMLDEIAMWNRALSAGEVQAIYLSAPPQEGADR